MEGRSLQEYINKNLAEISKYLEQTKTAVFIKEMENWEQDVDKLLDIKKNLSKINQNKDEIYLKLDMIDQTLRHMEEMNQSKGKEIKRCGELKKDQKSLYQIGVTVKKDITPFIKIQGDEQKKIIGKFEEDLKTFQKSLRNVAFVKYYTGVEKSLELVQETKDTITEHEAALVKYTYYSQMFGFPDAVEGSQKTIENVNSFITVIEKLW